MIFLADPSAPWPPDQMDAIVGQDGGKAITALRDELARDHTVSFFSTPDSLANAVSAAVYRHEVRAEFRLRKLAPQTFLEGMSAGQPVSVSTLPEIETAVTEAGDQKAVKVDLGPSTQPKWWTTRLYLLASLLDDLADVRIVAFTEGENRFVGLATPKDVRRRLQTLHAEISAYEQTLAQTPVDVDLPRELQRRFDAWNASFAPDERARAAHVRPPQLRQWLDTSLTESYVKMPDEDEQEEPMELIQRIIDWPMPFVALVGEDQFSGVVDRRGLAEHVARLFVNDQVRRARRT